MDMVAIDNDYFLVRFGSVDDLDHAKFGGPWRILDHYLIVKEWSPDFDPIRDKTEKVLVWIRFPCLPIEYYSASFLQKVGKKIGRPVRVDQATSQVSRGRFARMCVEIDLTKPLISKFKLRKRTRFIAYEGIHLVCFGCGMYGHSHEACPENKKVLPAGETMQNVEDVNTGNQPAAAEGSPVSNAKAGEDKAPFGAWMLVTREDRRKGRRTTNGGGNHAVGQSPQGRSCFAPIANLEEQVHDDLLAEPEFETEEEQLEGGAHAMEKHKSGENQRATKGRNQRRPNVVVTEKQVANQPVAKTVPAARTVGGQDTRVQSRVISRRAAEEEEHVVVRGSQGGVVVHTERIISEPACNTNPMCQLENMGEHFSDEPNGMEVDGDGGIEGDGDPGGDAADLDSTGAGGRDFHRVLKQLIRTYRPSLGLVEPKVSGDQANKICTKLGYEDWVRVEAVGFSGGIWVLWNKPLDISVKYTHPQFILLQVAENGGTPWTMAVVYGSPVQHLRRRLWMELQAQKRSILGPWIAAGDFNAVTCEGETHNYSAFSPQRSVDFADWIYSEGLVDMGFSGARLTWMRGSEPEKGARLDRALCNVEWRHRFPEATVRHLPRVASDHTPILLHSDGRGGPRGPDTFRFQAAWLTNDSFKEVIHKTWAPGHALQRNIAMVRDELTVWNREVFGNIEGRKMNLLARIGGIQRHQSSQATGAFGS
ncbi:PREDICTED: uncharacterized protein LOC109179603 [Ipomoea nil]|uniref:uncharacterized protein LOC109179603 n=1 Tax=Ipomoea nil TaxID=35883 RepID=UPI000901FADD|nr:PREDICTED: uncharacterized protein LOC109179603 [Ipomoea nil]